MPSTTIQFAWALQVKVPRLGAHLEAYHELLPTIYTVRLCNRYGTGPKAHITKLPVEMIYHIESFLIQAKRAKLLPGWVADFGCWRDKCHPIDHMSDAAILEIYNQSTEGMSEDFDIEEGFLVRCEASEVTPSIREYVTDEVAQWSDEGEWGNCAGRTRWRERVGHPPATGRGSFDKFAVILRKDFGLDVWISHTQEGEPPVWSDKNVSPSTIASTLR